MSGLKDILGSNTPGGLPEDKLMAYLEGKLSAEEMREVENFLSQEGFESDAIEGLKYLQPADTKKTVDHINHTLRKELSSRKLRRSKPIKDNPWALLGIALTILFIILAYFVIRLVIK
ncbi:MAG: hypothetical protein BGO69_04400 [Bacteroidetes bacterium 46-16]|nr:MAG: hypothetical protein BGO69_04400 [Bacteroidetes bacterium 46-16]